MTETPDTLSPEAKRPVSRRQKRIISAVGLVILIALTAVGGYFHLLSGNEGLERIHAAIERQYEGMTHLDANAVEPLIGADVIFFDVREKREFAVSHLPGAVRLPPKMTAKKFAETYGDRIKGKKVVFYCSVGRRASRMLDRVKDVVQTKQATGYNLKGGIFSWHNQSKALRQGQKTSDFVHPFGKFLVPLIERKDKVRFRADGVSD